MSRTVPHHLAIVFGTTNTVIATDRDGDVAPLVLIPPPGRTSVMAERTGTPVVPSAVYFPADGGAAQIGQAAVGQNDLGCGRRRSYAQAFKRSLGEQSLREVARVGQMPISARRAAQAFFGGLRGELAGELRPPRKGLLGRWRDWLERRSPLLDDLTFSAPVDASEAYRAELSELGRILSARTLRLIDEPVAAALGYGVSIACEQNVLVVDWGGGTLDVSIVRTGPETLRQGRSAVLAKSEAPVGGEDVDRWIVTNFLIPVERFVHAWEIDAAWAACRAKEDAADLGCGQFRFRDRAVQPLTRDDLSALLAQNGAYAALMT